LVKLVNFVGRVNCYFSVPASILPGTSRWFVAIFQPAGEDGGVTLDELRQNLRKRAISIELKIIV
jgi:hypothetical protein